MHGARPLNVRYIAFKRPGACSIITCIRSVVAVICCVLSGCATRIGGESEFERGAVTAQSLVERYGEVKDLSSQAYLTALADRLESAAEGDSTTVKIRLLNTSEPMAFSPG